MGDIDIYYVAISSIVNDGSKRCPDNMVNEKWKHIGKKINKISIVFMMVRKRKITEAKKRYDEKHPVVSVRVTKEMKEILDKYRGNRSYSEIIRQALENIHKLREASEKSFWEGYKNGKEGHQAGINEGYYNGYREGMEKGKQIGYKNGSDEGYSKGYSDAMKEVEPKLRKLKEYEEEEREDYFNRMMNRLLRMEEKFIQLLRISRIRVDLLNSLKRDAELYQSDKEKIKLYEKIENKLKKLYKEIWSGLEELEQEIERRWLEEERKKLEGEWRKEKRRKELKEILELRKLANNIS